ncbi:MAG TPA: hypothetical protein VHE81_06605 [Lacipirellulaceae bacterium]|nr:hypothetical protein [Lacipirellulaceae bacterium]
MAKTEDDGLVVEIDPRQLDLTLDPETEKKAKGNDEEEVVEPKKAPKEDVEAEPDDAIVALQKQLDALKEENARTKAAYQLKAREADEALSTASQAASHAMQSQYDLVNTDIANAKSRSDAIKRELKIARELGDTDRESDLQIENARIGVTLENSERKKREIELRAQQEKQRREAPKAPADPFEASIQGLSPKSQQWLRSHPECVTDDLLNAKVLLADKEAKRKGFAADTPEYFQYIEEKMGYRTPDDDEGEVETRKPERSERRASFSAPPSRDTVPGSSLKPAQRRLSREQVETAEALGMTPVQYATWLAKAEKDGKYVNH